jgi:hypothetical protein
MYRCKTLLQMESSRRDALENYVIFRIAMDDWEA